MNYPALTGGSSRLSWPIFAIPAVPLVIGAQVVGALALVVLYMISSAGRRA